MEKPAAYAFEQALAATTTANSGIAPAGEAFDAWECVGCGRIEAPHPCIGVCEDRKVRFVYAAEHEDALARLSEAKQEAAALESVVRRLAQTRPREGEWERCYKTLQVEARRALLGVSLARAPHGVELAASRQADRPEP
jgi:hypothetical protein